MDSLTLPVSEVFGPVWQGEGPHAGRRCWFVRLGKCNLTCEWCDSAFTWDANRYDLTFAHLTTEEIATQVKGANLVVLSGGEPLLHQTSPALFNLLQLAREWHVETNGTIPPNGLMVARVHHWTVSPKLNTRDPEKRRIKPRALRTFADLAGEGRAIFKFVVSSTADVDRAADLAAAYNLAADVVWVMPEGVTADRVIAGARLVADRAAYHGFNLTLRQQVLMYGEERAR
jgi:7-carboxy-7-deazaguanine synthase